MNATPIFGRFSNRAERRFAQAALVSLTIAIASALWVPKTSGQCLRHIGEAAHGPAYAVDIDGDRGLFGSGPVLMVVDLSDPATPAVAGEVVLGGLIRGLDQKDSSGTGLAVVAATNGLFIVTTDPGGTPSLVGEYRDFGTLTAVALDQDLVFATDYESFEDSGVLVIDITNPSSPVLIGQYDPPANVYAIDVVDGFAYVTGSHEMFVLDVSDPASPQLAGTAVAGCFTRGLEVVADFAYVACSSDGLKIFDVSDPTAPVLAWSMSLMDTWDVSVSTSTAFVANGHLGLSVVNVSNPYHPIHMAHVPSEGYTRQVGSVGEFGVIADHGGGFRIFDADDLMNPAQVAEIPTPTRSGGLAMAGNYAFVTDKNKGMWVFDVTEPSTPQRLALYPIDVTNNVASYVGGVTIEGNHAFVNALYCHIIDISDPADPIQVGTWHDGGVGAVLNGLAYTGSSDGLCIVDMSDLQNPVELGCVSAGATSVVPDGSYAYTGNNTTVQIIDVRNPYVPFVARHVPTPGDVHGMTKVGDLLYVTNDYEGLRVIDVSDPVFATEIGSCPTAGRAIDVAVTGSTALVSDYYGGVSVVDVSDPTQPTLVCTATLPSGAGSVALKDDIALVTAGDAGLWLFDHFTVELFADGFESGDTMSWSSTVR